MDLDDTQFIKCGPRRHPVHSVDTDAVPVDSSYQTLHAHLTGTAERQLVDVRAAGCIAALPKTALQWAAGPVGMARAWPGRPSWTPGRGGGGGGGGGGLQELSTAGAPARQMTAVMGARPLPLTAGIRGEFHGPCKKTSGEKSILN